MVVIVLQRIAHSDRLLISQSLVTDTISHIQHVTGIFSAAA